MGLGPDHKVLVVLDHGSRFAKNAGNPLNITLKESNTSRTVGKCDKSLWTWCVEATLELHRVVFDLFSGEHDAGCARLVRLVLADCVGRVLQPRWGTELVTQQEILNSLSAIGLPSTSDDSDGVALSGITLAIEALSQLSDAQIKGDGSCAPKKKEGRTKEERSNFSRVPKCWETPSTSSVTSESDRKVVENTGSVVIFTSFAEDERLTELENEVADVINCRNRIIKSLQDNSFSCINHVKLYIINVLPNDQISTATSKPFREISPTLSSCIFSRPAGDQLISVIHSVSINIYDLVSTTISGIPMKEEAQQGQSAVAINYDVELLHRREAHTELERLGLVTTNATEDFTGTLMVYAGSATYPTARLVWSTPVPKGRWNTFPRNRHASRVTPSAVNSRPSVCLSSYLLQGRNVMLEVTRVAKCEGLLSNVGAKLIAHTLIAHGGHIYIHANDVGPHGVLDCQATREKMQLKKAANGRISDFVALMKESSLHLPVPDKTESNEKPLSATSAVACVQPRRQLLRVTRYWPLRTDHCFIYNIPKRFDALFAIMRQPQLSTVDADKCKQVIHQLAALKDSRERLGEVTTATRLVKEGSSREDQLRIAFLEMARHLGNYINHSEKHAEASLFHVFHLFLQSTGLERSVKISTSDVTVVDRTRMKRQEPTTANFAVASASAMSSAASEVRNMSRSNSPLPKKPRKSMYLWKPNETLNLYDYLVEKEERHHRAHWVDFVGRVKAGNRPAHLYPNLDLSAASAKQD
ncbi:hypothetical protein Y032_0211g2191 [Ancylostoma ceylanicum]|uniref:Protein asunder n=1 Tax=Ancylostoma ceylanicum TaxID=53326 RepID=A0A016SK66_9BILA|nr:hypothetical protein Y032_0211g2191 [Ancylostoma ceylanicum]